MYNFSAKTMRFCVTARCLTAFESQRSYIQSHPPTSGVLKTYDCEYGKSQLHVNMRRVDMIKIAYDG